MNILWKNLLIKTVLWLVVETLLSLLGLDNVADYSEFVFGRDYTTAGYIQPAIHQNSFVL
ncbi:hypothetical protein [Gloeocapsopsis dulcis]|uniref:Uncharacterized protein n=1 Tax=Gloeocapsopsis dulcis AAB1 = 1H9 TaxID=1433147 RepID=A0A6N8FWP0_9CHRO|nr:hypothetical protein [Gloeocapsopsis dulcis]MUL37184.1 hypothetical protein [Gloeocapsopsis dulcis AAB1 = 1H9]WNN90207.1 hypothetical protein P0S91_03655 [Gloeocapsopsis dulcis]